MREIQTALTPCHWLDIGDNKDYRLEESINAKNKKLHHFRVTDGLETTYAEFSLVSEKDTEDMMLAGLMHAEKEVSAMLEDEYCNSSLHARLLHLHRLLQKELSGTNTRVDAPNGNGQPENTVYTFTVTMDLDVLAPGVSAAIRQFNDLYPDVRSCDIRRIADKYGSMDHVYSEEANAIIYFPTGCPFGYTGCIMDPMRDIAEKCSCQDEISPGRYVECDVPGPFDEDCNDYDDEDK